MYKELQHRDNRRASFHDYRAPGYYLITATAHSGTPPLSVIPDVTIECLRKGDAFTLTYTALGDAIKKELDDIPLYHPKLKIYCYAIMPDHIHIVIGVTERLDRKLGSELAGFFGACSKHLSRLSGSPRLIRLFKPFHDRLIFDYNQLVRAIEYVEDNPRRLVIKKRYPDLFTRYLHLGVGDREYAAYGNIFLLKSICLLPVRIHRRWTKEEFDKYHEYCVNGIKNGAIPISPAIHRAEKDIMNEAVKLGAGMIQLTDKGFEKRFKPSGRKFDLCAEGRLLLLAPWPENTGRKSSSGYTEFHQMNDLAASIASMPSESRLVLKNYY